MTEDERLAELRATFPVMSEEESERFRLLREEAERKHLERWGPLDLERDVNRRKWSDPVDLRVVEPAPRDGEDEDEDDA